MSKHTPGPGRRGLSDIVERLRKSSSGLCTENPADYWAARITVADALEAAEEIERLRTLNAEMREALRDCIEALGNSHPGADDYWRACYRAEDALAKAEGGADG